MDMLSIGLGVLGLRSCSKSIQKGLGEAFKKLRGRGRLTEANIRDGLGEVRKALLDGDVNFTVAKRTDQTRHRKKPGPDRSPLAGPQ